MDYHTLSDIGNYVMKGLETASEIGWCSILPILILKAGYDIYTKKPKENNISPNELERKSNQQ
ncbi:hypothetical protein K8R33_01000 [archaeon]|nr:hypothetical protein [archaeon]